MGANVINLTYNLPSDQVIHGSNITVGFGTIAAGYPPTNLADNNPARPAKLNEGTGDFLLEFPGPTRIDIVALLHHNLDVGLNVLFQGHTANDWSAPALSAPITIPPYRADGYSVQPFKNLTTVPGYTANGYQFWRLAMNGNSAAIAIGELWLGRTIRILDPNIEWEEEQEEERKIIEHSTDYAVTTVYDLGVTQRKLRGTCSNTPDVQKDAIRTWWRDARGRSKPFLIIPNGLENDAWFVRWQNPALPYTFNFLDQTTFPLEFQEVGRGLYLPTGPSGPTATGAPAGLTETFLTKNDERSTLANSRRLLAGENVTIDYGVPGEVKIHASGGGGGGSTDLDYLGDYKPATYNDGDIVIAEDGIAYMCVKNNTVTPPEPWPGVGFFPATMSTGGGGPVAVYLGGSRQFAVQATDWTAVPEYVRFYSMGTYTGKLYVEMWARYHNVGVTARLFNLTDGSVAVQTGLITSTLPVLVTLPVTVAPNKVYRLEILANLPGEDVFGIGTLGD